MARVDGYIRIDSKLDPKGAQEGMKGVTKAVVDGFKEAGKSVEDFESVWEGMNWEEKRDIIVQASDEIGTAWDSMTRENQLAKLQEVWEQITSIADESKDIEENVEGTAEATTKWSRSMSGLQKIMSAISWRTGRYFRGARGAGEITKSLKAAFGTGVQVLAIMGIISVVLVALIALMAAAVIGIFAGLWAWSRNVTESLYRNLAIASDFRDRVTEVKTAFDNVKGSLQAMAGTLLMAVAPVLLRILEWLVKMVNFATKFIAALTGQKSYMQYVADSATQANKQTGGVARNMKEAEKSAKKTQKASEGALAAWDELNVLAQDKAQAEEQGRLPEMGGMGGISGGAMMMEEVMIDEDFLANIWLGILAVWEEIIIPIWDAIWENIWLILLVGFIALGVLLLVAVLDIFGFMWKGIVAWAQLIVLVFVIAWKTIYKGVKAFIQLMIIGFIILGQKIWATMKWAWDKVKEMWIVASTWFITNVWDPFMEGASTAWDTISETFSTAFEVMKEIAKTVINAIIGFINGMVTAIVLGINKIIRSINKLKITVPKGVPKYGGKSLGFSIDRVPYPPGIPYLATGAVIPPNAPFAAILGDQRSGKNIEAPENLFRQIIQEEMAGSETRVNISFSGSMAELVRVMKPYIDKEDRRIGQGFVEIVTQ